MSKHNAITDPDTGASLRTVSSRFRGPALLVCSKCERKLRKSGQHRHVARLRKSLRKLAKADAAARRVHTVAVSCLKLCPRGAVTVCTQANLRQTPPTLTLIRTRQDVTELYRQCVNTPAM